MQKLFVDPSGCHVLVSAVHKDKEKEPEDAELLYVYSGSNKPRLVSIYPTGICLLNLLIQSTHR